jgi:chlorobactene glucosyltransferase
LLRTVVAMAVKEGFDFLSLEPRQELLTLGERLIIPAGLFALAFARDLRRLDDPTDGDAAANGQFLLISRAVYDAIGGHAAVRAAISEDSMLARAVKAWGGRIGLVGGAPLISARMYRKFSTLWEGLSKNSTEALGGVRTTLILCGLGVPLAWATIAVPVALATLLGSPADAVLPIVGFGVALLASLAVIGFHLAGARYLRIPIGYGLLFPIGYTLGAVLALDGLLQQRRGRVGWKGRIYAVGAEPRPRGAGSP